MGSIRSGNPSGLRLRATLSEQTLSRVPCILAIVIRSRLPVFPKLCPFASAIANIRYLRCFAPATLLLLDIMGLLATLAGPLSDQLSNGSTGVVVGSALVSFTVLAIILNVLSQLLFKNPKEPPVVFHWVPFVGSTVIYGIDPYKFFFSCREKVMSFVQALRLRER